MASQDTPATVLELFCGIGGLRTGFSAACHHLGLPECSILDALDISPDAAVTYHHNFGHRVKQADIVTLEVHEFDECSTSPLFKNLTLLSRYNADVWLMSPPCQPYTVQGEKKDKQDPRAAGASLMLSGVIL